MRTTTPMIRHLLVVVSALPVLLLSACGPSTADATPTMSVDEIYTAAYQTITAQQATQLALTPPTPTPSLTPSPTFAPPPTLSSSLPFGTAATSIGGGATGCDSSAFVTDVTIPDGTVVKAGKAFTKTWTMMNKGTCAWSSSYKFVFISGDAMGGTSVPLPGSVPAGQQAQISVELTAPVNPGNYTGTWRLQNPSGQYFGDAPWVKITVSGGSGATNTSGTPASPTETLTPTP